MDEPSRERPCNSEIHCNPKINKTSLLFILLLSSSSTCSVRAQGTPPLHGQGVSPFRAGYGDHYLFQSVYVSVDLLKLQEIDEKAYEFRALLEVYQTWEDPRAEAAFNIIDAADLLLNKSAAGDIYSAVQKCASQKNSALNFSTPDCVTATKAAPPCAMYCATFGASTDNPFRCCDILWLPDIVITNLIDITQDRILSDEIKKINITDKVYVTRTTRITGRFFTPLKFQRYPFDKQSLLVLFDIQSNGVEGILNNALSYRIVPSATFRDLMPVLLEGPGGESTIKGMQIDELASWSIDDFKFQCANTSFLEDDTTNGSVNYVKLMLQTQDYNPQDPYAQFWEGLNITNGEFFQALSQACTGIVSVSRLSSTQVVQSILPVAFVGFLAFVVFFSAPDDLDLRLGTEVTLFLSLTAVQFIFVEMLPLTSYLTAFDSFIVITYGLIMAIVIENVVVFLISTRMEHEQRRSTPQDLKRSSSQGSLLEASRSGKSEEAVRSRGEGSASFLLASSGVASRDETNLVESSIRDEEGKSGEGRALGTGQGGEEQAQGDISTSRDLGKRGVSFAADDRESSSALGVDSKSANDGDSWWSLGGFGSVRKAVRLRPYATAIHTTLANNPVFAYRTACRVDRVAALCLLFLYVLLSVLNFTVGF